MRLQKHLATSSASPEDLAAQLERAPGALPLLRALQQAHTFTAGAAAAAETERSCCIAAAKVKAMRWWRR